MDLAIEEARQEEEEEKAIELSVEPVNDITATSSPAAVHNASPQVPVKVTKVPAKESVRSHLSKQADTLKAATTNKERRLKQEAMGRLKKAMERKLKLKEEEAAKAK